jgi:hypothetical protein
LGIPNSAPTISPTLFTKIMSLQFDMVNANDLEEGVNPFNVGSRSTAASRSACANATNYDLLHQGSLGATMVDISTFRNSDKVSMPTNLFHVASALLQYRVLLYILLKSDHPITIEFDRFCTAWNHDEADLDELRKITPSCSAGSSSAWLIGSPSSHASAVLTCMPRTSWNSFRRSSFRNSGTQVFQSSASQNRLL